MILPVLVSGAACFFIGFLMHGPVGGKLWMKLANITPTGNEKLSGMWKQMLSNYVVNIICAFVLSGIIATGKIAYFPSGDFSWWRGALVGLWVGVGFVATWTSMDVIWMGKSWKLWLYDTVSFLISVMIMGAILAVW